MFVGFEINDFWGSIVKVIRVNQINGRCPCFPFSCFKNIKRTKVYEKAIKNWPEGDGPREKLLKKGARTPINSELLAILLRTGTPGVSAIDLARDVLKKISTFRNMAHTDIRGWRGGIDA